MKKAKFSEWFSVQMVVRPSRIVLIAILVINIVFFLVAAEIISLMSLDGTERMGFIEAAFYTVTMILDPGCISYVVEDIGQVGAAITIMCLIVVIAGMLFFTGTVIGYITNVISDFISESNSKERRLDLSGHVVILNWNMRGAEIVNELLFYDSPQKVVVLSNSNKDAIEREINERLLDTMHHDKKLKNNVTVIVREGDVFSTKQLYDISIKKARMIVILDEESSVLFDGNNVKGNPKTIKALMQVADITDAFDSDDDQKVLVEVTDDWTTDLVNKIIAYKQVKGKSSIVPLSINRILGQLIAQFTIMPDLNLVYRELFSNRGATVFAAPEQGGISNEKDESEEVSQYLSSHRHSIPLTTMANGDNNNFFYVAKKERDAKIITEQEHKDYKVDLNTDYWIESKNVIVIGHNSRIREIMEGFSAFRRIWNYKGGGEILKVVVIDDEKSLEKMNFYSEYPFVVNTVAASVYDEELIADSLDYFVGKIEDSIKILILSDDDATGEEIDAKALANLVYVQEIKAQREQQGDESDAGRIDVIVEINDPKHNDIVKSYNVNNVVISNRYISKIISQIGEKEELFDFYLDILTYGKSTADKYNSKEIYSKKVSGVFNSVPGKCTADQLIRAIYEASSDPLIPPELRNPMIALGYVKPGGRMTLFSGDQRDIEVELEERDKIVLFSNH